VTETLHATTVAANNGCLNPGNALGAPDGKVTITWSCQPPGAEGGSEEFQIDWREANGAGVREVASAGFGRISPVG
jgi:hypothetical protein